MFANRPLCNDTLDSRLKSALLSNHARLARCSLRPSSPFPRRLRIENAGQYDLPFPVEMAITVQRCEIDPVPRPLPACSAGETSSPKDSKTLRQRAARREHRNRKPVAKEAFAANGGPLRRPEEAPAEVGFLRLPEVKAITGLSKSSLYALIQEKSFPAPVRVGARAVGWVRSEVMQWAAERVHASRSAA